MLSSVHFYHELPTHRLMMQEDFETNRQAAEQISKILNILEEHGQHLALLLEQRAD